MEKKVIALILCLAAVLTAHASKKTKVIYSDVTWIGNGAEEPFGNELILTVDGKKATGVFRTVQPTPHAVKVQGVLSGKRYRLTGTDDAYELRIEATVDGDLLKAVVYRDYGGRKQAETLVLHRTSRCWYSQHCGD